LGFAIKCLLASNLSPLEIILNYTEDTFFVKLPKIFIPEKGLEDKINQLEEEPKTNKKDPEKKPYSEELEKLLSEFHPVWTDYEEIYLRVKDLAEKAGYSQIKNSSNCEYLVKQTDFGESYMLVLFGRKFEKHYVFARLKEDKVKKFCNRLEYQRKMVYPKSLMLTGLALSASLTISYACYSLPVGTFLRDMVSWMIPSMFTIPTILLTPRIVRYVRNRVGKGLDKYCVGLIVNDDRKALEAAFS